MEGDLKEETPPQVDIISSVLHPALLFLENPPPLFRIRRQQERLAITSTKEEGVDLVRTAKILIDALSYFLCLF